MKKKITPEVCQFCGCTKENACQLGNRKTTFIGCSWVNRGCTVCSNPACIRKAKKAGIHLEAGI